MKCSLRRRSFSLRGFVAIWFEMLLGYVQIGATTVVSLTFYQGTQNWKEAQAAMEKAGCSVSLMSLAPAPLPEAENFGAAPTLHGLAARDEDRTPEIKERLDALQSLSITKTPRDAPRGVRGPEDKPGAPQDWAAWRAWLSGPMKWPVPPELPDDARAVLAGMRKRGETVIPGLLHAAKTMPGMQVTPSLRERVAAANAGNETIPDFVGNLSALLAPARYTALRMEAALAAGESHEAPDLLRLFAALRELAASENTLISQLVALTMDRLLGSTMERCMAAQQMDDALLRQCQEYFSARNGRAAMLRALEMENAFALHICSRLHSLQELTVVGAPSKVTDFGRWQAELIRGLMVGNMATFCEIFLPSAAALRQGWAELHTARARLEKEADERRKWYFLHPLSFIADGAAPGYSMLLDIFAHADLEARVQVIRCALARHRLAGGNPPERLEQLPGHLLQTVPADLDGQPLRSRRDGDEWVIWSVGFNLKDDWHGKTPPVAVDTDAPHKGADWQWRVK